MTRVVGLMRRAGNGGVTRRAAAWALLQLVVGTLLLNPCPALGARGDSSKGYDADLTLFSPEGKLYQVEYVMRAVGHYGCPAVGVHGDGCCVVACKRDLPDELVYPDSVSSIFRITDDIYSAATGLSGDVRYQVKRARLQALEYKRQYGSPMPSRLLALAMADAAQVNTQHAALRPMACVSFVISVDDPTGPALFRVEPSGQVFQAWATAAGRGSAASLEFLEAAFKTKTAAAAEGRGGGSGPVSPAPAPTSASSMRGAEKEGLPEESKAEDGGEKGGGGGGGDGSSGGRGRGARDGSEGNNTAASTKGSSDGSRSRDRRPGTAGFGLEGEGETVELALRALSQASSGKGAPPLTDKNVEIAIASRETGVRVCSRKEVTHFLGKMALSADCDSPKLGR